MRNEAEELWVQARADYATASLLRETGYHYAAVFFSQQAAEKALKSVSIEVFRQKQQGHNLISIADTLHAPLEVMNSAAELNGDYLSALYPEPCGGIPCQRYDQASADLHLRCAEQIMAWARAVSANARDGDSMPSTGDG